MSIAYQCRKLVLGPTVGYQVGGQGDGSGYKRQNHHHHQQQQEHQQDATIRGLSCISIYVHSNNEEDNKPCWKATDALGGSHDEVFRSGVKERLADPQLVFASTNSNDSGCSLGAEFKLGTGDANYRGVTGGTFQHSPKDSVSDCSSSIGKDDSLSSSIDDDAGDMEVESKLKGPLDSMAELENSLPIKRGLSNFFSGKSKSFTCLSDVTSVKELAKPENPYNKRHRNLLPYSSSWERNRFHFPRNSSSGISKKAMHSSKTTLALAVVMSKSEDSLEKNEKDIQLPPLPTQGKSQRSFV
ncbi:hypothetical protein KI387_004455 [Taxus chinensis]|uniref:Uncharacterized protein n=1 Tax=Taxus chinensis TaxID=29808 RepID=A0AA38LKD2_TAXCH|nr:hypothetical protein KI387_004455 [Taxus chinensis]